MTATQKKLAESLGLTENDFAPTPRPEQRLDKVEQRTDALETATDDMILLMADLIGGM